MTNTVEYQGVKYRASHEQGALSKGCDGCAFDRREQRPVDGFNCGAVSIDAVKCDPQSRRIAGLSGEHVIYLRVADAPYIILEGDPVGGYKLIGPFATEEEANDYPNVVNGMDDAWHVAQLTPPEKGPRS